MLKTQKRIQTFLRDWKINILNIYFENIPAWWDLVHLKGVDLFVCLFLKTLIEKKPELFFQAS